MKSILEQAVRDAASKANAGTTGWDLLASVGPFAAIANLPLAVVMTVVGAAGSTLTEHKNLSEAKMPDEWLGQVSGTENLSKEGLAFLARCLADKGYVTVQDAMDWIGIEEKAAKAEVAAKLETQPGASSLLNRANKECGTMLEPSLFDQAISAAKLVSKAAPDVLNSVMKIVSESAKAKK